ncbi:MAG: tetratricopeptide repeat protein [Nitrospira sp.]|nr:tetratricopeptide repeat protein [Nitrospira sp.]
MRFGLILLPLTVALLLIGPDLTHAHSFEEHAASFHGDISESPQAPSELEAPNRPNALTELEALRRSIRLLPNVPEYRLQLADALLRLGELDSAIEECRAAIRLQPDDGRAHLQLGLLLSAKQDWRAAGSALKAALRLEPNLPHAHYSLGTVHYSLGDVTSAIRDYRRALELRPHFVDAHHHLGLLLMITGQLKEAIPHLETAALGGVPEARLFLGNAYKDGQGVEKNLGLAIYWWMQAVELGEQTSFLSLSKLRRQTLAPGLSTLQRMELLTGFQAYRTRLWNDYPDMSRVSDRQSLGKALLAQGRGEDAIWALLKEGVTLSEEAHALLATLYETGPTPYLKPFDRRILACFETTAADGFPSAKKLLARIYGTGLGVDADLQKAKAILTGLPKKEAQAIFNELGIR